ncbi:2-amino-4-hydroxy-6-hydroxymethyldihydropteridine diphosphokinase, partial [Staphylococcus epidermidis]|uniref:2-amino-4-hydroxy-6- hydroxymethyldihydropteridine diphosphokinase n=1 Tax=Staphylococcus epidermidis TaxID=1282 RepID=UPI0011A21A8C
STQLTQVSHIYQTEPLPYTNQPKFLNLYIHIHTQFNPQSFLKSSLTTQQQLHPKTQIPSAPTTLHIHILLFPHQIIQQHNLSLPHPTIKQPSFLLIPLNHIPTKQIQPISNKTIPQLLLPHNTLKKY